jgi:pre-rRNA-processing protein TSR1
MSKLERKNQARQKQRLKRNVKSEAMSIFSGPNGAARQIAVIPLSPEIDTAAAISQLNESVEAPSEPAHGHIPFVRIDRFKQNVGYIPAKLELISALDACRVADFVLFVLPAKDELEEEAQTLLRAVEGQGISNILAVVQVRKQTPERYGCSIR